MDDASQSWAEQLEPVVKFLNTSLAPSGDPLASVAACRFWLSDRGHPSSVAGPSAQAMLLDFRCALHDAVTLEREATHVLSEVAERCRAVPSFAAGSGGSIHWRLTAPPGAREYAAELLTAVLRSLTLGTWARVRVCPGPGCGVAFIDATSAGRRTWCAMARCGNRVKQARWRVARAQRVSAATP